MNTEQLTDIHDIERVYFQYAYLVDTQQPRRIALEIFTSDAIEDHGEGLETNVGTEPIVKFFEDGIGAWKASQHSIGNVMIDLNGDTARARAYVQAYHWSHESAELGPADYVSTGVYLDEFRRTPAGWRISHRRRRSYGTSPAGIGGVPGQLLGSGGTEGTRDFMN